MWSLSEAVSPRVVEVPRTASTNVDMRERAGEWPHLGVLVTRDQHGGRGRLDRVWQAPPGASLAISVLLEVPRVPGERRGWIPLVAGAAMAGAVAEQLAGREVGVKWPNDVLVDGRKICGILAEIAAPDRVVVGSGVNTRMTADQLPVPTATSFAALGADVDDDRLLASYLTRLRDLAGELERGSVRAAIEAGCVTIGQRVTAHLPGGGELRGIATGLDDAGRLLIDGTSVAAGDIVHLRR